MKKVISLTADPLRFVPDILSSLLQYIVKMVLEKKVYKENKASISAYLKSCSFPEDLADALKNLSDKYVQKKDETFPEHEVILKFAKELSKIVDFLHGVDQDASTFYKVRLFSVLPSAVARDMLFGRVYWNHPPVEAGSTFKCDMTFDTFRTESDMRSPFSLIQDLKSLSREFTFFEADKNKTHWQSPPAEMVAEYRDSFPNGFLAAYRSLSEAPEKKKPAYFHVIKYAISASGEFKASIKYVSPYEKKKSGVFHSQLVRGRGVQAAGEAVIHQIKDDPEGRVWVQFNYDSSRFCGLEKLDGEAFKARIEKEFQNVFGARLAACEFVPGEFDQSRYVDFYSQQLLSLRKDA